MSRAKLNPVVTFDIDGLRDDLRAARFSLANARVDEALAAGAALTADVLLERARFSVRREPAKGLAFLGKHASRFVRARDRAEATLREGVAYAQLGDDATASAKFKRAAEFRGADDAFVREIALQRARAAWMARKLDTVDRLLATILPSASGDQALEARVVLGATHAARGNLSAQGGVLLEALALARSDRDTGVFARATIASQIAFLARELSSSALRDAAYAEVGSIAWTPDLADVRFSMLRAVGWRYALDGDEFNAFRNLKRAAEVAPNDALRVMSSCDRAYFAEALGERRWAEQELSDAQELAERVNWNALDGEERFALLLLAERCAARDPALALAYVARYRETGRRFARTLSSRNDRRVDALEAYAFGTVQRALGEDHEASRLLRSAYKIYDSIDYDWRAARAALELAALTGEDHWKKLASDKLTAYPNSWLSREPGKAPRVHPSEAALLTPSQRAVYNLLLHGHSTLEIATEQGRSEFTIRNHVKAILKAFNVRSRTALLARANAAS